MDLFFVPYDPLQTVLVTTAGVAYYSVHTDKVYDGVYHMPRLVTTVQRPADSQEASIVAEIAWKTWGTSTTVYGGMKEGMQSRVIVKEFLYRQKQFSRSRYFVGNDGREYRWKPAWKGFLLTAEDTGEEVASFRRGMKGRGLFSGERKAGLHVEESALDLDLVVLSLLLMEKKRLDHAGDGTRLTDHDEDPQGDGGEC